MNEWYEKHPIAGNGYFSLKHIQPDEWINSMFLAFLHDSGVIGLTIFILIIGSVLWSALKAIQRTSDQKHKAYMIGMVGGFIVMLVSYNFSPGHTLAMFWVHLGLIWVLSKYKFEPTAGAQVHQSDHNL
ncbi:hypothetical protein D3C75_893120 [compost metagenome]